MKTHLIKYVGSSVEDYYTTTYCGMNSDNWSENFNDNMHETLTDFKHECTCKKCLASAKKERKELKLLINKEK